LARLFREDPGVKGCGWFAPYREQRLHVLGNVVRILFHLAFSPFSPFPVGDAVGAALYNFVSINSWDNEIADTPDAVLQHPPQAKGDLESA
ncbi:hypothetical protein K435DRAFT_589100, partial [Dendrothele bispora CBS 962.96]